MLMRNTFQRIHDNRDRLVGYWIAIMAVVVAVLEVTGALTR